ncbi:MAG TPA: hypothetical protein VKC34_01800, partial [Blastocatellia bacterium]|nr:hypothetical protein [Blastocatellia bacterium]
MPNQRAHPGGPSGPANLAGWLRIAPTEQEKISTAPAQISDAESALSEALRPTIRGPVKLNSK